jgi:hypothetical protein
VRDLGKLVQTSTNTVEAKESLRKSERITKIAINEQKTVPKG